MQWIVEPKIDIVERLNTVREGMEAGLDDWPIASQIYEYKTAAEEITTLRQRVAELEEVRDAALTAIRKIVWNLNDAMHKY